MINTHSIMEQLTVRRIASTLVFGAIALYLGSSADLVGIVFVALAYVAGAASVALGPRWLGAPGRPPPRYGWAAAGSAFGLLVAGAAAAMNLQNLALVLAGAMAAFVGGVVLGLAVIRYPDAPP